MEEESELGFNRRQRGRVKVGARVHGKARVEGEARLTLYELRQDRRNHSLCNLLLVICSSTRGLK